MKATIKTLSILTLLTALTLWGAPAEAADDATTDRRVTFAKDVLPILQANCQTCHRVGGDNLTGMIAPMSFMTFEETRPWAKSIAKEAQAKRMPPWKASPDFHGIFRNERTINEQDVATLVKWARTGAQRGRREDAPAPRTFGDFDGWKAGKPDLVVEFNEPFLVEDDVEDLYARVTVELTEEMLPESRWIKSIEWRGGSDVVHHIVGYAFMKGADPDDPATGYGLGSIAPGEEAMEFPDGYAKVLAKGTNIIFSMHYHKEPGPGTAVEDVSKVAFRFHEKDADIEHFVEHNGISGRAFEIPPGQSNWKIGAAKTFDVDTTIIAMHPHMHLRGKDAKYIARYPDGTSEVLLNVPAYDFNWQTDYLFDEPKKIPAGTRIEFEAHFDNSVGNAANPNPAIAVLPGRKTTDEMMIGFITYAKTDPETITIDSAIARLTGAGESDEEEEGEE